MIRPRKRAREGEGSFLASVSDLMAGLVFIFIATLMIFALQLQRQLDRTEKEEARAREERAELVQRSRAPQEMRRALLKHLKNLLAQNGITVEINADQGVLTLPEGSVSFVEGRDTFDNRHGESERRVRILAQTLAQVLPCYSAPPYHGEDYCQQERSEVLLEAVLIEGHTDKRRHQGPLGNWRLSALRAIKTYDTLLDERREPLGRLVNHSGRKLLSVAGYAETRPVDERDTPEAYRRNRRIDLRFIVSPPPVAHLAPEPLEETREAMEIQP